MGTTHHNKVEIKWLAKIQELEEGLEPMRLC